MNVEEVAQNAVNLWGESHRRVKDYEKLDSDS